MVDVKDLKARNLQALVVVNKASRGWREVGAGHETDEKMETVTMSDAGKRSNGDAND
ncbi:hypothetical protein Bca4012_097105 [Brassica carinata]